MFLAGVGGLYTLRIAHAIKTIHTGIRVSRGVQALARVYNAGLRFYQLLDKAQSGYELFQTVRSLLDFDADDLREIRNQFVSFRNWVESAGSSSSSSAASAAAAAVPSGGSANFQVGLSVPLRKQKAVRRLLDRARVLGRPALIAVQEKIGEALMYAASTQMGFSDPGLDRHGSNGFDQLLRHSTGIWGIFEAKGGNSRLGRPAIGNQMSGKWINHWINDTVRRNPGDPNAMQLRSANTSHTPMLAVVTRFNAYAVRKQITITGKIYTGPNSITSWPRGT